MARFRLTPAAQLDLELIWDYTLENFGTNQALIYTDGIDSACQLLADAPVINRPRQEYKPTPEHASASSVPDGRC